MNGRASTILTALVVAALIAVGVAYLIANPALEDGQLPTPSSSPTSLTPPIAQEPAVPSVNNVVQEEGTVNGIETGTSAPTGTAEWVMVGLVAMIAISGWNLVRLHRAF